MGRQNLEKYSIAIYKNVQLIVNNSNKKSEQNDEKKPDALTS